jgi:hypothetical protein
MRKTNKNLIGMYNSPFDFCRLARQLGLSVSVTGAAKCAKRWREINRAPIGIAIEFVAETTDEAAIKRFGWITSFTAPIGAEHSEINLVDCLEITVYRQHKDGQLYAREYRSYSMPEMLNISNWVSVGQFAEAYEG